jgi:hypothetical protein
MKKLVFSFFFLFALLISCSKNNDNPISYGDDNLNLKLRNVTWYTKSDSMKNTLWYSGINLKISGFTNADALYIRTNGDGLWGFPEIKLNNKKEFSEDLNIAFLVTSERVKEYSTNTTLLAIKNNDTLRVDLESGKMKF